MIRYAGLLLLAGVLTSGCVTNVSVGNVGIGKMQDGSMATGFVNQTVLCEGEAFRYVLYVPYEYTPEEAWPLIVSLHGAGERGDDGLVQTEVGIGTAIRRNPERFPALVLMPQCPEDSFWDEIAEEMDAAIAQTQAQYAVDADRITLTGLSMGGYGTWMWGALKTDTFAAFLPICGGGDIEDMRHLMDRDAMTDFGPLDERVAKLATRPIWAFHGADDSVVPPEESQKMVNLVKAAGGNVKYKEYRRVDHNSWDRTYGDKKVIDWLLEQHR